MQTSSLDFVIDQERAHNDEHVGVRFPIASAPVEGAERPMVHAERPVARAQSAETRRQAIAEFENEFSDVPALVGNAEVLAQNQERALALVLLRQAMSEDSFHVSSLRRIYNLLPGGEWTLAERTAIAETLSTTTKLASDTLRLAKLEYEKGDLGRSLEMYFEAAAQIREEDQTVFEIYKDIGNIYVRQGDFDGAEEYYHKAFALNPDSDALHVNLGTLEIQRQEWGAARDRFRFALGLNERNDKAWVGLALAHYHLGDTELAFGNLEKAIDLAPGNRTAVLLLAGWAEKHNRTEEAINALENYLGEVSFDEDMSLALIQLFCREKNYFCAKFEIERTLLWNPTRPDLFELLKKIEDLEGAEAEPVFKKSGLAGEIFG